ncbi:MAG: hypothetical protein V3T88_03590 [Nitrosomonadaceae bacterium]
MADTYVDRGYVSIWDFDKDDFIADGTWRTKDFSSLVPSDAKRVDLLVIIRADQSNVAIEFSEFALPGFNVSYVRTQTANVYNQDDMTIKFPSDSKILAYYIHNKPVAALYVIVKGWWI